MKKKIIISVVSVIVLVFIFFQLGGFSLIEGEQSGFRYEMNSPFTCTIIRYLGEKSGTLIIPEKLNGIRVTIIGFAAFTGCEGFVGQLIIPENITFL